MALIEFSSVASAPFLMFEETAKAIFERLNEVWMVPGGWSSDELPALLEKLEQEKRRDKEQVLLLQKEAEKMDRQSWADTPKNEAPIHFYQRVVPLENMLKEAMASQDSVMWQRKGR